ncbi:hypothetical protein [Streptomyces sediminimaris]|uniref:hypothetical protein n=1 Tax=Streptomyces sediminimaris TaxID=3383721 RepID=UPI00399BDB5B
MARQGGTIAVVLAFALAGDRIRPIRAEHPGEAAALDDEGPTRRQPGTAGAGHRLTSSWKSNAYRDAR